MGTEIRSGSRGVIAFERRTENVEHNDNLLVGHNSLVRAVI